MNDALLNQIKMCLDQYGIENEIRVDRAEGSWRCPAQKQTCSVLGGF